MSYKDTLDQLLGRTYTKESLRRRLRFMRDTLERYYFSESDPADSPISDYIPAHADKTERDFFLSLSPTFYNKLSQDEFYKVIQKISQAINLLPELGLTLPFSPTRSQLKKLTAFARKNIHPRVMLKLSTDPAAVGGALIEVNNHIYDYSLSRYIRENKTEILEKILNPKL